MYRTLTFLPVNNFFRWLETVSTTCLLMSRYNHSLSLDATIMVSKTAQPLVNMLLSFS